MVKTVKKVFIVHDKHLLGTVTHPDVNWHDLDISSFYPPTIKYVSITAVRTVGTGVLRIALIEDISIAPIICDGPNADYHMILPLTRPNIRYRLSVANDTFTIYASSAIFQIEK